MGHYTGFNFQLKKYYSLILFGFKGIISPKGNWLQLIVMFKKIKTYLTGRKFLYLLNAETDAVRAEKLVQSGNLVEAYCQYYWNGWYDYLCGCLYGKCIGNMPESSNIYEEINDNFFSLVFNLFWPLVFLFFGQIPHRRSFQKKFGVSLKDVEKSDLVKACILVQEKNIESNFQEVEYIDQAKSKKSRQINKFLEKSEDKKQLKFVIKNTLKMAGWWDKLFAGFLKFRFARILG